MREKEKYEGDIQMKQLATSFPGYRLSGQDLLLLLGVHQCPETKERSEGLLLIPFDRLCT
jgi:hypothetical protein